MAYLTGVATYYSAVASHAVGGAQQDAEDEEEVEGEGEADAEEGGD